MAGRGCASAVRTGVCTPSCCWRPSSRRGPGAVLVFFGGWVGSLLPCDLLRAMAAGSRLFPSGKVRLMPDFNRKISVDWKRVDVQHVLGCLRHEDDANALPFK